MQLSTARLLVKRMRVRPPSPSAAQAKRKLTGIMNYTNPGVVSHNEILEMYRKYIDSDFTWSNFTLEEQAKVPLSHTPLPHRAPACRTARIEGLSGA